MKNSLLLLASIFTFTTAFAQDDLEPIVQDTVGPWKTNGNASFLFNQSTFDNWVAGGENNISGNIGVNYDFNYKKGDWAWDNKVIASYGLVKTRTSSFAKKTDDRLELNSILGKRATEFWYYSFSGMLWKKSDNLRVNLSPATSKFTFVDKGFTLPNEAYFGVKEGESIRYELGFNASAYYKLDVIANVSFENILNLYSNYLEETKNVDLDYQLNIVLRINRYLTTNISFQTIYDDNAFEGFQIRQVFGVAANYGF
ncbi:MAG: DUF3078 domain-containing protein [Sphingobacteriales bacterium]|nr:MAG: DUF3078 domain-containing protein [Sphingobacteriales bacterium]